MSSVDQSWRERDDVWAEPGRTSLRPLQMQRTQDKRPNSAERSESSTGAVDNAGAQVTTHTQQRTLECYVCTRPFTTERSLRRHQRKQSCRESRQCKICQRWLSSFSDLQTHLLRTHTFPCAMCPETFSKFRALKTHLRRTHTRDGKETFECAICQWKFSCRRSLMCHLEMHTWGISL